MIVSCNPNINITRLICLIGLVVYTQILYSQKNITITDKDHNPIPFVEAIDIKNNSLLYRASGKGIISLLDTNVKTLKLVSFNYIEKIIYINKLQLFDTVILEQKENILKDVTVSTSTNPALLISAYVRNYTIVNDTLNEYLDAIVDYIIPQKQTKGTAKYFLKQYRIYSQKSKTQKKRFIQISPASVNIPRFAVKSVLDTQAYSILANDNIVFKKYPDSIAGSINLKDSVFTIKIAKQIYRDTSVHDFLGYRIKFLHTIKTEAYSRKNNKSANKISEIKNLISEHSFQNLLYKHKEESNFKKVDYFSDIIVLNTKYIDYNKKKSIQSIKFDREKSSYQTPFWNNYMNTLPENIKTRLENLILSNTSNK